MKIHCGLLDKIGAPSDRRVTVKSGIPEAIFSLILVLYSCKYILFPDIPGGGRCAAAGRSARQQNGAWTEMATMWYPFNFFMYKWLPKTGASLTAFELDHILAIFYTGDGQYVVRRCTPTSKNLQRLCRAAAAAAPPLLPPPPPPSRGSRRGRGGGARRGRGMEGGGRKG
jgi:hypothetical protein